MLKKSAWKFTSQDSWMGQSFMTEMSSLGHGKSLTVASVGVSVPKQNWHGIAKAAGLKTESVAGSKCPEWYAADAIGTPFTRSGSRQPLFSKPAVVSATSMFWG